MVSTPFKALLFFAGSCTAAAAAAYMSVVFEPYLPSPLAALASLSEPSVPSADPKTPGLPGQEATVTTAPGRASAAASEILSPSFDLVRVEGDGSIVIAGKAAPNAKVEIDIGARVIGNTVAGPDGSFAIVIDEPLKPGGYQIVLRSTAPDDVVAISLETAVVSIPETESGQVLILIEQQGEPSKLVTVPKTVSSNLEAASATTEPPPTAPTGQSKVAVEAVEIEGRRVFVAGVADPGRKVRAYADDVLLGETEASPGGRFLIEVERDLPVGDHIIRIDALELDGVTVVGRVTVPFAREPGEAIAAVAPTAPAASEALAPKLQNVDGAVIIRRGDTLWQISRRVYGHGVRYTTIYLANQTQIRDPNRIWPGQVFTVPGKTPEGGSASMKAVGRQATTTSVE
jgi:nucleoid-associated protein YgaU